MEFERRAELTNTSTRKRQGKKARELIEIYGEEKAKKLMKRLRTQGMFHWDEDFVDDEEVTRRRWLIHLGSS